MKIRRILDLMSKKTIRQFSNKFSKNELRKKLTPLQFSVTQESYTERPFTGEYNEHFEKQGNYCCVVCDNKLFKANQKYDSSCGWPAFFDGIKDNINEKQDDSHGMNRIEVLCKNCQAHLGHVFNDGPKPTGIRYCINSASLKYQKTD